MKKLQYSFLNPIIFVVILWQIKLWELNNDFRLVEFGIYPREWFGFFGIISWIFIHGDIQHLLSNTFPLLTLGAAMYYFYDKLANWVILNIYIFTGLAVWLLAKPVFHIGASGIVYGMFGFLFFGGIFRKDKVSIAISLLVTLFYGGILWGIFPIQENVSWEGHLFGLLSGLTLSFFYRKKYLPQKEYSNDGADFRHPNFNYIVKPPNSQFNQNTNTVVMIRPHHFGFNPQTSKSNVFQHSHELLYDRNLNKLALEEFNSLVGKLRFNGINVLDFEDNVQETLPDAIFPNNWISMHHFGEVYYYPMLAQNRRKERREDIIDILVHQHNFTVTQINNFAHFEDENQFLEGTGSLILDHQYKIAYANISSRTTPELFYKWCKKIGYYPILFEAKTSENKEIYHTNVLMSIGEHFVVICFDAIPSEAHRNGLKQLFKQTNKEIIEITEEQLYNFCGNILELKNNIGDKIIIMSDRAYNNFTEKQLHQLSSFGKIIHSNLATIENFGGGSARCMLAEVFLPIN